jgi:transcriptional regulator with XRE-family HTH domain
MLAEEIKALRQELSCSTRELAVAVGVEQATVLAWEKGESFPTKKHAERLAAVRAQGKSAIVRISRRGAPATPMAALADPELWTLLRKLIAHPELRKAADQLAATYDDPAETK